MKQTINGYTYDTMEATEIGYFWNGKSKDSGVFCAMTLFVTEDKMHFIHIDGLIDPERSITPVTKEEAFNFVDTCKQTLVTYMDEKFFENHFFDLV